MNPDPPAATENSTGAQYGKFHPRSDDGCIVNDCRKERSQKWDAAIHCALAEIRERLGDRLRSVYLRGSLARGTEIDHVSDLDLIVIYKHEDAPVPDWSWEDALEQKMKARFDFFTGLDINFISDEIALHQPRGAIFRFVLKVQSICIFGEDLAMQLPPCKPDASAMFNCREIAQDTARIEKELLDESDPDEIKAWCGWAMKRVVRAAGEIAMLRNGKFTRDLELCALNYAATVGAQLASSVIPEAFSLAIHPCTDKGRIIDVIRRAVEEMAPHLP